MGFLKEISLVLGIILNVISVGITIWNIACKAVILIKEHKNNRSDSAKF